MSCTLCTKADHEETDCPVLDLRAERLFQTIARLVKGFSEEDNATRYALMSKIIARLEFSDLSLLGMKLDALLVHNDALLISTGRFTPRQLSGLFGVKRTLRIRLCSLFANMKFVVSEAEEMSMLMNSAYGHEVVCKPVFKN